MVAKKKKFEFYEKIFIWWHNCKDVIFMKSPWRAVADPFQKAESQKGVLHIWLCKTG